MFRRHLLMILAISSVILIVLVSGVTFLVLHTADSRNITIGNPVVNNTIVPTVTRKYHPLYGNGWYDGCALSNKQECNQHLDDMSTGGFKVVINYSWTGTQGDLLAYAAHAQQVGMSIIWSLKDVVAMDNATFSSHYATILGSCGCSTRISFAQYAVNLTKNLPATIGYYIADEPTVSDLDAVVQLGNLVHQIDPNHFRLLMISNAVGDQNLETFAKAGASDIIGEDYYYEGRTGKTLEETSSIAARVQEIANKYYQKAAMTLQAFSLAQYTAYGCENDYAKCPFPSESQMQAQEGLVLQQPLAIVLWYTYPKVRPNDTQWQKVVSACQCK